MSGAIPLPRRGKGLRHSSFRQGRQQRLVRRAHRRRRRSDDEACADRAAHRTPLDRRPRL